MNRRRVAVIGGGAAGFFAAIAAADQLGNEGEVHLLEKGAQFLAKVQISGGGRCNVTHACFDPIALSQNYPRGGRELRGAFHRFQPSDTQQWFLARGVELKVESDGRMFPVTDSSATIIECLMLEAKRTGVQLRLRSPVQKLHPSGTTWLIELPSGAEQFDAVLVATGGWKSATWTNGIDHQPHPSVPSLFSFHLPDDCWLRALPGLTVNSVEISVPGIKKKSLGSMVVTHQGISGPAVLKLSAWSAEDFYERKYQFPLRINWLPEYSEAKVRDWISSRRSTDPAKKPANTPFPGLPLRLWEKLVFLVANLGDEVRWTTLSREKTNALVESLLRSSFSVTGKSTNKEEFVTCGGIRLAEVDFHTMESKLHPGLYFAGEVLNLDGITGGFNFQAAWTTGWIAGHSLAGKSA